nr:ankyrin repeat domain-containing protein [Wolbachia endosymbiont of Folsomia candida]
MLNEKKDFLDKLLSKFKSGEGEKFGNYINYRPEKGFTALGTAIYFGKECNAEVVELLLKYGADAKLKIGFLGYSPLTTVCLRKISNIKVVELLIQYGADINSQDKSFFSTFTALSSACLIGHTGIVEFLLKRHADPNLSDPLYSASRKCHVDVIKLLLQYGAEPKKSANGYLMGHVRDHYDTGKPRDRAKELFLPYGYNNDVKKLLVQYGGIDKEYLMLNTVFAFSLCCIAIRFAIYGAAFPLYFIPAVILALPALLCTYNALYAFIKPTFFPTKPSHEFVEVESERVMGLEGDVTRGSS